MKCYTASRFAFAMTGLCALLGICCWGDEAESGHPLDPTIISGKLNGKPYAAALTPQGWVGGRRWFWMSKFHDGVSVVQERAGGKVGAIDEKGHMVLPLKHDYINPGEGVYAVTIGKSSGYLRRDGSVALPMTDKWEAVEAFSLGMAPVKAGGKWGYIDMAGNWRVEPTYDEAKPHERSSGLARVMKNGLWGWINTEGKETIPATWHFAEAFTDGRARVQKEDDGLFGYVDTTGKLAIPLLFEKASRFAEGHAVVARAARMVLIDTQGREVFSLASIHKNVTPDDWQDDDCPFPYRQTYSEGVACFKDLDSEKWGAIDLARRVVIPAEYDSLSPCSEGKLAAHKDRIWGFLKTDGSVAIPFTSEWTEAGVFQNELAPVRTVRNSRHGDASWGYINHEGNFVIPAEYQEARSFNKATGLALTKKGDRWGWIDSTGLDRIARTWLNAFDFEFGLAPVQSPDSELWGYIDTTGKIVIPLRFSDFGIFGDDGFALVEKPGGKRVCIGRDGQEADDAGAILKARRQKETSRRIESFSVSVPAQGLVKFGIEEGAEVVAFGLARLDGSVVEGAKWPRIEHRTGTYTVLSVRDEDSSCGMPTFKVHHSGGALSRAFPLPLDAVEDIDNSGAHTVTGGINRHTLFPFPVSPEFEEAEVVIPPYRHTPQKTYDHAYFIAWSGKNDHAGFLNGVKYAADRFMSWGAETHVFAPLEEAPPFPKTRFWPEIHDSTLLELKKLITAIKKKHRGGEEVSITFFFASHGSEDGEFGKNGYAIAGPLRRGEDGISYKQDLNQEVLAYLAKELAEYDVRCINGTCFGANTDDVFFATYLRERVRRVPSERIFACSSVLANWHMLARGEATTDERYWPRAFVDNPPSASFFQGSLKATLCVDLGAVGDRSIYDVHESSNNVGGVEVPQPHFNFNFSLDARGKIDSWNLGMTSSERILYYDQLIRSKKFIKDSAVSGRFARPVVGGTDELDETYFSLSLANLAPLSNVEFAALFEDSRRQTEDFVRSMNVSENVRTRLGIGKDGRINFQLAATASRSPSIGTQGRRSQEYFVLYSDYEALIDADKKIQAGAKVPSVGRFGQLSSKQVKTKLHETAEKINEMKVSEHDEMQRVLVVIKRLALMLDFLNNPNVPKKRKDLFAWYRAEELRPLMPKLQQNRGNPNAK